MRETPVSLRWVTSRNSWNVRKRFMVVRWQAVLLKLGLHAKQSVQLEMGSASRRRLVMRVLSDGDSQMRVPSPGGAAAGTDADADMDMDMDGGEGEADVPSQGVLSVRALGHRDYCALSSGRGSGYVSARIIVFRAHLAACRV